MDKVGLREVFAAALEALEPERLVHAALRSDPLEAGPFPVTVLGLGKAAAAMARGVAHHFEDVSGVVITLEPAAVPDGLVNIVGSHPTVDESSVAAGYALLDAAHRAPAGSLAICLLSGGGSALAEVPRGDVSVAELASISDSLMLAGANIEELNSVRAALSKIKGGGLAAATSARLVTLAISDVAPLPARLIASGPTCPPAGLDPASVLEKFAMTDSVTPAVRSAVEQWVPRLGKGDEIRVIADGALAATAAAAAVEATGRRAVVAAHNLAGEARREAERVILAGAPDNAVCIHWGETTVTVTGNGTGGRNHEAALAAAIALDGEAGVFLAAGTDGIDGTTNGAGAVVDGSTAQDARVRGLDPVAFLHANDSGGFFDMVPGRIDTGPTGTNVADLWLYTVE
ncbi:MAG: DUF4147 domain-containing protein [Acidimicrobiia bacterium]|nr:DUF4147 domain-containing protein [Acidimicrobiia bacterium]